MNQCWYVEILITLYVFYLIILFLEGNTIHITITVICGSEYARLGITRKVKEVITWLLVKTGFALYFGFRTAAKQWNML
jgi:hypothetical protein